MRPALTGRHNVANALAATAVGLACGLPLTAIRDGLESLQPVEGRLRTTAGMIVESQDYFWDDLAPSGFRVLFLMKS